MFSGKNKVNFNEGNFESDFICSKVLGTGAFAQVKLCKKADKEYAVKIMKKSHIKKLRAVTAIAQEIILLKKLNHENIGNIHEVYQDDQCIYLIVDLCSGGVLFDVIVNSIVAKKKMTHGDISLIIKQILKAINHCHGKGIIHCDLKLENILLKNTNDLNSIKVVDFGLAREPGIYDYTAGTPGYCAPETISDHSYQKKSDIWAIGILTYMLLFGKTPFGSENNSDKYLKKSENSEKFIRFEKKLKKVDDKRKIQAGDFITNLLQYLLFLFFQLS